MNYIPNPLKSGTIVIWFGYGRDIPAGWSLCDGNNGTPDLTNRFVVGAGDIYEPQDSGGLISHDHGGIPSDHGHSIGGGVDIAAGAGYEAGTSNTFGGATTDASSNLPPYYALAYMMRL